MKVSSPSSIHWYWHSPWRRRTGSLLPHRPGHDRVIPQIRKLLLSRHRLLKFSDSFSLDKSFMQWKYSRNEMYSICSWMSTFCKQRELYIYKSCFEFFLGTISKINLYYSKFQVICTRLVLRAGDITLWMCHSRRE